MSTPPSLTCQHHPEVHGGGKVLDLCGQTSSWTAQHWTICEKEHCKPANLETISTTCATENKQCSRGQKVMCVLYTGVGPWTAAVQWDKGMRKVFALSACSNGTISVIFPILEFELTVHSLHLNKERWGADMV